MSRMLEGYEIMTGYDFDMFEKCDICGVTGKRTAEMDNLEEQETMTVCIDCYEFDKNPDLFE
ncbi:hypothetical protein ABR769_25540 [Bacillus cereus]|uniref:hypothetical protein n=1 Tax=Bacillus cereus TaxID=1396 RepID=UPI00031B699F|nr:hypothetical protein [Bacillus cereus]HDR4450945.1 hypothetical protein [Bacillus cereus]